MWSMVKMQEARSKHASTEMDLRVKVRKGMWEAKQARKTLIQTLYWTWVFGYRPKPIDLDLHPTHDSKKENMT